MKLKDADKIISQCEEYANLLKYDGSTEREWATVKRIMQIINEAPTIEPDSDTISRQAAIDLIERYCDNGCEIAEDKWCPDCQQSQFAKMIKALPPSPSIKPDSDTVSRQQARHEKTCEGCKWEGENYRRDECQLCTRNFPDRYAKR